VIIYNWKLKFYKSKLVFVFIFVCFLLTNNHTTYAQSVDLLWQGDGYVPPFYKGHTLWSNESRITFVAIPQNLGNPSSLNYKWTKDGTVLGNINGVGKNILSFPGSVLLRPEIIKVDIISDDNTVLATNTTLTTPIPPVLIIYEANPLYGYMFHHEINGVYQLKNKEVTMAAFPFFFSINNRNDQHIGYEWRTNQEITEIKNLVTYRVPDDKVGTSQIEARVSHQDKVMQGATKSFLIKFGENTNGQ
jgi:hypothetical protein